MRALVPVLLFAAIAAMAAACGSRDSTNNPNPPPPTMASSQSPATVVPTSTGVQPTAIPSTTNTPVPPPATNTSVPPPPVPSPTIAPPRANCNPNYSGACLDKPGDYDCAGGSGNGPNYTGRVTVIGVDVYDLDRDGDGIGCE